MGDPQRLLSSIQDDDEVERELLGSLRNVGPRPSAKHETWKRLAVSTAAVATIGTGSAAVQALGRSGLGIVAHATKALTAKVVLGVAIAGSTAAGGSWLLHERSAAMVKSTPRAAPAPMTTVAPAVPLVALPASPAIEAPLPEVLALVSPPAKLPAPKNVDESRARRDSLSVENRLLTQARAELHAGDPRGALATLDKLRARSPKGVLTQERDVLTIQILSSLGDVAAAKRKAKEFLEAYPESPHAPQVRRLASDG